MRPRESSSFGTCRTAGVLSVGRVVPRLRPFVDAFSLASEWQVASTPRVPYEYPVSTHQSTPRVPIRVPGEYPVSTHVSTPVCLPGSAPLSLGASEWRRTAAAPFGYRYNSPLLNRAHAAVPMYAVPV